MPCLRVPLRCLVLGVTHGSLTSICTSGCRSWDHDGNGGLSPENILQDVDCLEYPAKEAYCKRNMWTSRFLRGPVRWIFEHNQKEYEGSLKLPNDHTPIFPASVRSASDNGPDRLWQTFDFYKLVNPDGASDQGIIKGYISPDEGNILKKKLESLDMSLRYSAVAGDFGYISNPEREALVPTVQP